MLHYISCNGTIRRENFDLQNFNCTSATSTMAPKRKNDDTGEPSARERKKLKMAGARTISIQETPTAPATNQANAVASSSKHPSKTTVQFDCTYSVHSIIRSRR